MLTTPPKRLFLYYASLSNSIYSVFDKILLRTSARCPSVIIQPHNLRMSVLITRHSSALPHHLGTLISLRKSSSIRRQTFGSTSTRSLIMDPTLQETAGEPISTSSVTYNGISYTIVREGLAEILNPQGEEQGDDVKEQEELKPQTVFYNPIQQFNRDLSVLAIRVFGDDLATIRRAKGPQNSNRKKKRKRDDREDPVSVANASTENGESNTTVTEPTEGNGEGLDRKPPFLRFQILDALSASGLRAFRYAKEIPVTTSVIANDLSAQATTAIKLNISHNNVSEKVQAITGDAQAHMYSVCSPLTRGKHSNYEVIDLDPYGTAAPFLDAAVRALVDGGLLCVTCTDAGIFASLGYLEKTYSHYGGLPFKGPQSHEAGLRLILHAIASCAARNGLAIEPLLSLSIDFYARVFVRVRRSLAEVKFLASKTMVVYNCDEGCGAFTTQFLSQSKGKAAKNGDTIYKFSLAQGPSTSQFCPHCNFKTHLSGPMWGGPIHNPYFIQRILDLLPSLNSKTYATIPRIEGMLSVALNESVSLTSHSASRDPSPQTCDHFVPRNDNLQPFLPLDPILRDTSPFFIVPSNLAKILHCVSPSDAAFRGALANLKYRTSRSHTKPGSICTDAPWSVIWEIMREWVRQKAPIKSGAIKEGTAGWGIMRNDRSQVPVREMKRFLRERIDKCRSLDEMEAEFETAFFRLRGLGEGKTDASDRSAENEAASDDGTHAEARDTKAPARSVNSHEELHKLDIVFDEELGKECQGGKRLVRYQVNPRAEWGPIARAKGG